MRLLILATLLSLASLSLAADCVGTPNPFPPKPLNEKLIATVKNGRLYVDDQVNPPLRILHLYGTDYEMGYAAGQLVKDDLKSFIDQVMIYMDDDFESKLPDNMPQDLKDLIAEIGIAAALDMTYEWTLPYTPKHFEDELLGMADGSGIDVRKLRQVNMIAELIKAGCSMVGAWGGAIPDGTLYQLRALDWDIDGPFADYPALMIYHPNEGHDFANYFYLGMVGAITGYSSAGVGISEKVWSSTQYNGTYMVKGYPFNYLLRDILQFDVDTSAALNRIMNAHRTCSIFIGLGDKDTNQFRCVEYSPDILNVFSDVTFPPWNFHPMKKGITYIEKHEPPRNTRDGCLGDLLVENYGKINAQGLITAASVHQTGDTHCAVYDFARDLMYVSSASSFTSGQPVVAAYDRQFLELDLNKLWAEPKPTA